VVRKTAAEMCGALAAASRTDEALRVQEQAQLRDGSDEMKKGSPDLIVGARSGEK